MKIQDELENYVVSDSMKMLKKNRWRLVKNIGTNLKKFLMDKGKTI